MARKQTPDILGDLLGGRPEQTPPESQQDAKPGRQQASNKASQKASKLDQDKTKATFYISQETLDSLEEGWLKLRKLAKPEARAQVSKSGIVETALDILLHDLEANGPDSQLARMMVGE